MAPYRTLSQTIQINRPRGLHVSENTADAEDITQEVFLALLEKQPHFESEEHLKAWLLRVAINKSKNALKSGWFTRTQPLFEALPALSPQENEVLSCVLSLDEKYRIPIHLFIMKGIP